MRLCILFSVFIAAVAGDNLFRSPEVFKRHILARQGTCTNDQVTCTFGGCCDKNSTCVVINSVGGCCPIGVNCGQSSGSSSQKGNTATKATAAATTSQAAAATTSVPPAQNGCASGFISCNDGTGGCCPAGSQVSSDTLYGDSLRFPPWASPTPSLNTVTNFQCVVDASGVPGCSAACSDSDTKCPAGGCCAAGLSCDPTKPGFCLPAPGTNTSNPTASKRIPLTNLFPGSFGVPSFPLNPLDFTLIPLNP